MYLVERCVAFLQLHVLKLEAPALKCILYLCACCVQSSWVETRKSCHLYRDVKISKAYRTEYFSLLFITLLQVLFLSSHFKMPFFWLLLNFLHSQLRCDVQSVRFVMLLFLTSVQCLEKFQYSIPPNSDPTLRFKLKYIYNKADSVVCQRVEGNKTKPN